MAVSMSLNSGQKLCRIATRKCCIFRTLCYPSIPLNIPVGNVQTSSKHREVDLSNDTTISTLSNGLRVASQESFGQYCTIGVFVDAGSRHQRNFLSGVTHLLSKLSFMGSSKFPSSDDINTELERYGGVPDVKAFRDLMFYNISCYAFALPQAMMLLSDVFWRPQISHDEFEESKYSVLAEHESLGNKPVPEELLMELAHQASYKDNTLGLPSLCTPQTVNNITLADVYSFLSTYFIPSRLVIVGVNVDHSELVKLTEEHFVNQTTSWNNAPSKAVHDERSMYTGGIVKVPRLGAPIVGPNPLPTLTHVAISLESSSYKEDDFYTSAVLNSLMGGGGSFSAGGPGKGMYTQLYLRVLNQHYWIYHAQALNNAYSDSGVFSMFGSTNPKNTRELVDVLCNEFYNIPKGFDEVSIERAKKMLKSSLLMNLESRVITFEDIGRQVLGHNQRYSAEYLCERIDDVTASDIRELGEKMCNNSIPSVAALGDLSCLPDMSEIMSAFKSRKSLMRQNFFFKRSL